MKNEQLYQAKCRTCGAAQAADWKYASSWATLHSSTYKHTVLLNKTDHLNFEITEADPRVHNRIKDDKIMSLEDVAREEMREEFPHHGDPNNEFDVTRYINRYYGHG